MDEEMQKLVRHDTNMDEEMQNLRTGINILSRGENK